MKTACCLAAFVALTPLAANAEAVSLVAKDRTATIQGTLTGYELGIYVIETELGLLRISSDVFDCRGNSCPKSSEIALDRMMQRMSVAPTQVSAASQ